MTLQTLMTINAALSNHEALCRKHVGNPHGLELASWEDELKHVVDARAEVGRAIDAARRAEFLAITDDLVPPQPKE